MFKKIGLFEGTAIYESWLFSAGHGLTLPQIGITTFPGAFSKNLDRSLIQHEFGHILQYQNLGGFKFYTKIGLASLWSAIKASMVKNYYHQNHWVERDANCLAYRYFNQPKNWDFKRFPTN